MIKLWRALAALVIALGLVSTVNAARPSKPMHDFNNIFIVPASGATLSDDQIEKAIIRAAQERGWTITPGGRGVLNAHLAIRTHTVDVAIRYDSKQYDVIYRHSVNLGFAPNKEDPAHPLIHPNYNKWVQNLVTQIDRELNQL